MLTKVNIQCPIQGQAPESTLVPFVMISKQGRVDETNELVSRILKNISQFFVLLQKQMPQILRIYPTSIANSAIQYLQLEQDVSSSSTGSPALVLKAKFTDLYKIFDANENFATETEFDQIRSRRIDFLRVDTLTRCNISSSSSNNPAPTNIAFIQALKNSLNPELDFTHFVSIATKSKHAFATSFALKPYTALEKIGNKLLMGFSKYMHENKKTYEEDETIKNLPTDVYVQILRDKANELFEMVKSKIETSDDFVEKGFDSKIFEIEIIIESFRRGKPVWVDNLATIELVLLVLGFEIFIKLIPSPKPYSGKSQESVKFALELIKLSYNERSTPANASNYAQAFEEKKCKLLQFRFDPLLESYYLLYLDIIFLTKQIPSLITPQPIEAETVQKDPHFQTLSKMVNDLASQLYPSLGDVRIDPGVWFKTIPSTLQRHIENAENALNNWLQKNLEPIPSTTNPTAEASLANASSSSSSSSHANSILFLVSILKDGWGKSYQRLIEGAFIREREGDLKKLPIIRRAHYDEFLKQQKDLPARFLALKGFRLIKDAEITSANVEELLTSYVKMHALSFLFDRKLNQMPNRSLSNTIFSYQFLNNLEKFNKIARKIGITMIDPSFVETFLSISKKSGQSSFQTDPLQIYSANEVFDIIPGLIIIEQIVHEVLLTNHEEEQLYGMVSELQEQCYSNTISRESMKADTFFLASGYTARFSSNTVNAKAAAIMKNVAGLASDLYQILHHYLHSLRPLPKRPSKEGEYDEYMNVLCTAASYPLYEKLINDWNGLCPIKLGIISREEMEGKPPTPIHLSTSPITAAHAVSQNQTATQASMRNNNNNHSSLNPQTQTTSLSSNDNSYLMPGIPAMTFNANAISINWIPVDDDEDLYN